MKIILRQLALLLGSLAALYVVVLGVSLLVAPMGVREGGLDTGRAGRSLYLTEPKYVFLARGALDTPRDKLILLGASNVVVGFRQQQMQALMPSAEVHNLAVGGSNVTQLRQIVDLVHAAQTPEARSRNTFVVGLWYGLFADDAARWNTPDRQAGDTDIDIERYRYGFYRRSPDGPRQVLPDAWLPVGLALIHPSLVMDRVLRDATDGLRARLKGKAPSLTDEQRNAIVLTEADKKRYLDFWSKYMGGSGRISAHQVEALRELVAEVRTQGGRIVLVDLPLPDWHANRSSYERDYGAQLEQLTELYDGQRDVSVLALGGIGPEIDFSDEVHPKPRVAPVWARQLASELVKQEDDSVLSLTNSSSDSD